MGESERFFACCRFQLIWFQWKQKKQRERERERDEETDSCREMCLGRTQSGSRKSRRRNKHKWRRLWRRRNGIFMTKKRKKEKRREAQKIITLQRRRRRFRKSKSYKNFLHRSRFSSVSLSFCLFAFPWLCTFLLPEFSLIPLSLFMCLCVPTYLHVLTKIVGAVP